MADPDRDDPPSLLELARDAVDVLTEDIPSVAFATYLLGRLVERLEADPEGRTCSTFTVITEGPKVPTPAPRTDAPGPPSTGVFPWQVDVARGRLRNALNDDEPGDPASVVVRRAYLLAVLDALDSLKPSPEPGA